MLFSLARPLIFRMDSEAAHRATIAAVRHLPAFTGRATDSRLAIRVAGLNFPSPVGLAPGFDKNAEVAKKMLRFGFGFAEIGTVTPKPQPGNPQPRLFRLVEDKAVINRMGFNNDGALAVAKRLRDWDRLPGLVGVNIGANKDSPDRIADYAEMTRMMASLARYLTVNISSPNTPGLRALQDEGALAELLDAVIEARGHIACPIFLKLAPDLEDTDIAAICRIAIDRGINALIIGNTTISRPKLKSPYAGETGGLSGAPLAALALEKLRAFRRASGGQIPLIAAGGIDSAQSAYERIQAGASLVQLYSALVYKGPRLAHVINKGLITLLEQDGYGNLADAIGKSV